MNREWNNKLSGRKKITNGAKYCILKNGLDKFTIKDLCDATGLSAGQIYRIFRNKEEIVNEFVNGYILELTRFGMARIEGFISKSKCLSPEITSVDAKVFVDIHNEAARNVNLSMKLGKMYSWFDERTSSHINLEFPDISVHAKYSMSHFLISMFVSEMFFCTVKNNGLSSEYNHNLYSGYLMYLKSTAGTDFIERDLE